MIEIDAGNQKCKTIHRKTKNAILSLNWFIIDENKSQFESIAKIILKTFFKWQGIQNHPWLHSM